jgi:predicted nuclease of predicted toxin-antitoxin system
LTQDLDFSEIIALSGKMKPSLISLRLSSSHIEFVNAILEKVLPSIEKDAEKGAIISVEDDKIRIRHQPF